MGCRKGTTKGEGTGLSRRMHGLYSGLSGGKRIFTIDCVGRARGDAWDRTWSCRLVIARLYSKRLWLDISKR